MGWKCNLRVIDGRKKKGGVLVAGVKESIFGERADLSDRFFEVRGGRVGKVGAADTVCKNGVTDK